MDPMPLDAINIIGFIITSLLCITTIFMAKATYQYFKESTKKNTTGNDWFKINTKDYLIKLMQYSFIGIGFIKTTELLYYISTPNISPFVIIFFFAAFGGGISLVREVV